MADPESGQQRAYWRRTRTLALILVSAWFIAAFLVHAGAPAFNQFRFLGFPLGFYIAAQGSLIAFVMILIVYVLRQDRLDRDFGMNED